MCPLWRREHELRQTHMADPTSRSPNLVFILLDQQRHDFLSCYGAPFVSTPHMDRIGNEGVRYEQAYSPHPVCVSARVALLTGLDSMETGTLNNGQFLRPDHVECGIRTWPEILSDAGYYTCAIGKMHFYPWDLSLGFEHRVICEDKRWLLIEDDYYHFLQRAGHRKYHGNEHEGYHENRGAVVSLLPWECYWDHFVGSEAAAFVRQYDRDEPLAMMVGFPGPHCPYDPTPEYLRQFDAADMPASIPEAEGDHPRLRQASIDGNRQPWNGVDYTVFTESHKRRIRAHYAALVKQIDDEVGEILAALESRNMLDDTLVVLASDHGDYLGDHDLIGKGTFFEASCHVPLMARPPRTSPDSQLGPRICGDLVSLTDVFATLLGTAGCDLPDSLESRPLPGLGLAGDAPREVLCGALTSAWMALDGRTKLHKYGSGETLMFDLAEDPTEQRDLLKHDGGEADYQRLDAELTSHVMRAVQRAHLDKQVYVRDMSADPIFGRPGWQRTFPRPLSGRR